MEYTIDVSTLEIGKKARGPFFVKTWKAVSFKIWSCLIIVVYALLSYFLVIFLLKYFVEIKLFESQFIISSYFFKTEKFFLLKKDP